MLKLSACDGTRDAVEELGISNEGSWCGVLELVPCICPREKMAS
jgi:hypothetical protein